MPQPLAQGHDSDVTQGVVTEIQARQLLVGCDHAGQIFAAILRELAAYQSAGDTGNPHPSAGKDYGGSNIQKHSETLSVFSSKRLSWGQRDG